jgi:hypothetical protein
MRLAAENPKIDCGINPAARSPHGLIDTTAWSSKPDRSSPHGAYWIFASTYRLAPIGRDSREKSHGRPSTRAACRSLCVAYIAYTLIWLGNAHSHHAARRSKEERMGDLTSVVVTSVTRIQSAGRSVGGTGAVRKGTGGTAEPRPARWQERRCWIRSNERGYEQGAADAMPHRCDSRNGESECISESGRWKEDRPSQTATETLVWTGSNVSCHLDS